MKISQATVKRLQSKIDKLESKIEFLEEDRLKLLQLVDEKNRRDILKADRIRNPKVSDEYKSRLNNKNKQFRKIHIFQHLSKSYKQNGLIITPMELWSMAKRQRGLCGLSGKRLKGNVISVDHIIPTSRGGTDAKDNLRLVCLNANIAKNNLTDTEFLSLCQSILTFNKN